MVRGSTPQWVHRIPVICGAVLTILGTVVLAGWIFDVPFLTTVIASLPPMKPNSALALIAAGLVCCLTDIDTPAARTVRQLLALFTALVGGMTLLEWIFETNFHIDRLIIGDATGGSAPGRPSPQTATSLVLFGLAQLTYDSTSVALRLLNRALVAGLLFVVGAIELGYLYGAHVLTDASRGTGVSVLTAFGLFLLAIVALTHVADEPPLVWLWDDSIVGTLVRRLLPVCIALPPALGFVRLLGQDAGWYDTRFGIALHSGTLIVALVAILTITARTIQTTESDRQQVTQQLEAIFENIPASLAMRDMDGNFIRANSAVGRSRGVEPKDMVGRPVSEFYPPEAAADLQSEDAQVFRTRETIRFDYSVHNAEGELEEFEVTRFPVIDSTGTMLGVGTFALEVTDRKRAEHESIIASERFRALLNASPDGTVIVASDGRIAFVNSRACDMFGYQPDELLGQPVEILVPDALRAGHNRLRDGYFDDPSYRPMGATLDLFARHKSGRTIPVEISLGPLETDDGVLTSASIRDVTAKRLAADSLRAAEQLFRSSFDDAPIGMALLSIDGLIEQANPSLAMLLGFERTDLIGIPLSDLVHHTDRETLQVGLDALLTGRTERLTLDLHVNTIGRDVSEADMRASVLRDETGQAKRVLVQVQDVTERKRYEEQLQYMADHDPLTGLYNRRKFESELEDHISRCKRYGPEGALIALDIDHFKQVNDTLGHNVGDQLIISVAGVLRQRLRDSDVLARLGGDEFAVLLPKATNEDAAKVAASLVESVRTNTGLLGSHSKNITTSAGVAMFDAERTEDLTGEEVMIEADVALYDAKEAGRDTFAFYAEPDNTTSRTRARLGWTSKIESALADERFALMAQPILDLSSNEVHQYELLVRMIDEHGDLIPPSAFLYIAERYGLVTRIDEWVFGKAVELVENRPELRVEINLSAQSLGSSALLDTITDRLRNSTVHPDQIIFEVTETAAVSNIAQAQNFAHTLRDLGCRFALDDFGAGFGSFYYLKHLPFDYVKIDGEFIQHAVSNRIDQLIIAALVRIARGLDKQTIAEFVTNDTTRQLVRNLGVDYAQGYGIGMPIPLEELIANVGRTNPA